MQDFAIRLFLTNPVNFWRASCKKIEMLKTNQKMMPIFSIWAENFRIGYP